MSWLILLVACAVSTLAQDLKIGESYDRCRNAAKEEVAPCVRKLVNDLKPLILHGIPELGINTEPLQMGDLDFAETSGDNFIEVYFYKPRAKGANDMTMTRLEIDYENMMADWAILFPSYLFNADYKLNASLLFFPLVGEGKCWFNCQDLVLKGISKFAVQDFNGKPHVQEVTTDFGFDYGNITARLNNLFGGDPFLMEAGAIFVDQNVDAFVDAMRSSVKRSFKPIGGNVINVMLQKIPLEDIAGYQYMKR